MSKTQSKQHSATWTVRGRGKSRQFLATLPAQQASVGDRVKLESKAGVVTTGQLVSLEHSADGLEFWTLERDSKTPEQLASDRSKRAAATAQYWESEAGQQTAQRIADRNAKRAAEQSESESKPAASESKPASKPAAAQQPAAGSGVQLAQLLAELIAAGMDAATAAATATATIAQLESQPAPAAPASKPAAASKPQSKPAASADSASSCEICGDKRRKVSSLRELDGATLDSCARCVSLDDDTARIRAARTASK